MKADWSKIGLVEEFDSCIIFPKILEGYYNLVIQWNPDFSNLLGKSKLIRIIEVFEKSGVKLQCLTGKGKSVLVRIIGSFEKPRVREIGILL